MASFLKQLISKVKSDGSSQAELDSEPKENPQDEDDQDCTAGLAAQPQSPSPEAEYDKLLVSGNITACCAVHECVRVRLLFTSSTYHLFLLSSKK